MPTAKKKNYDGFLPPFDNRFGPISGHPGYYKQVDHKTEEIDPSLLPAKNFRVLIDFLATFPPGGNTYCSAWFMLLLGTGDLVRDGDFSHWRFQNEQHRFIFYWSVMPYYGGIDYSSVAGFAEMYIRNIYHVAYDPRITTANNNLSKDLPGIEYNRILGYIPEDYCGGSECMGDLSEGPNIIVNPDSLELLVPIFDPNFTTHDSPYNPVVGYEKDGTVKYKYDAKADASSWASKSRKMFPLAKGTKVHLLLLRPAAGFTAKLTNYFCGVRCLPGKSQRVTATSDSLRGTGYILHYTKDNHLVASMTKDHKNYTNKVIFPAWDKAGGTDAGLVIPSSTESGVVWTKQPTAFTEDTTIDPTYILPQAVAEGTTSRQLEGTTDSGGIWYAPFRSLGDTNDPIRFYATGGTDSPSMPATTPIKRWEIELIKNGSSPVPITDSAKKLTWVLYWKNNRVYTEGAGSAQKSQQVDLGSIYAAYTKDAKTWRFGTGSNAPTEDGTGGFLVLPIQNDVTTDIPEQQVGITHNDDGNFVISWLDKDSEIQIATIDMSPENGVTRKV